MTCADAPPAFAGLRAPADRERAGDFTLPAGADLRDADDFPGLFPAAVFFASVSFADFLAGDFAPARFAVAFRATARLRLGTSADDGSRMESARLRFRAVFLAA